MKSLLITLLLILSSKFLAAQDFARWNASLNITTSLSGILLAPAANFELNQKLEIGFMPIFRYYKNEFGNNRFFKEESFGLNFTTKYYFSKENLMDPYVAGIIGYGLTNSATSDTNTNSNFYNVVLQLGNEIQLGQKGWSIDFNIGLLGFQTIGSYSTFQIVPSYSLGIKKRFLMKLN